MNETISIAELAPFALLHIDDRRRIRSANTEAQILLGHSEKALVGKSLSEVVFHDSTLFELLDRADRVDGDLNAHGVNLSGPGVNHGRVFDIRLRPVQTGEMLVAFTEALVRDPVESAAGVAGFGRILGHEVKNPLAGISGAAQLLMRGAREDQASLLEIIRSEAHRIERLVTRLSAFELFSAPRMHPFNIHALLDKVLLAEEAAHGGRITLVRNYDPSLPEILGDEDHLHEAFQNIVRNASEAAMDNGRRGQVTIQTAFETGFAFARPTESGRLDRAIRITIEDDGGGIPAKARESMFDMFASSKSGGRGLGLSIVSEVVAAHDGRIKVESRPGQTRFSVFLPMSRESRK